MALNGNGGKLAVGFPWDSPFMYSETAENLMNLQEPENFEVRLIRGKGWCPAKRHVDLCEKAIEWGADLICIVGADQIHPEDMLVRLVRRFMEGYEVVGAIVPTRGFIDFQPMKPFERIAWRMKDIMKMETGRPFRGLRHDPDMVHAVRPVDGGMQRVNFIGSGVLMFHRDHLLSLEKPWFRETVVDDSYNRIANMDCSFVYRLQTEAFATVWVDTSIDVKHLSIFPIDDTYPERFADMAKGAQVLPCGH